MTFKQLRVAKGLSQAGLANAVGVSQQSVQRIESGAANPSPKLAIKIARVFGLSLEEMWAMFYEDRAAEQN